MRKEKLEEYENENFYLLWWLETTHVLSPKMAGIGGKGCNSFIERFSFECRKTKTKVITLANHKDHRQYSEPIKTRSNYM